MLIKRLEELNKYFFFVFNRIKSISIIKIHKYGYLVAIFFVYNSSVNRILIGNIAAFISSVVMVLIGLIKDKKNTLIYQTVDFGLMAVGNAILGGISGFITNIISIVRNIVCIKYDFNLYLKIFFIGIQGILIFIFNKEGIFAVLPFIAMLIYVMFLDTKDAKKFKASICISQVFWLIYDLSILNFAASIFDVLTIITNSYALYQIFKDSKNVNKEVIS